MSVHLEDLVAQALHETLDSDPVDVGRVVTGTRKGIRRSRTIRASVSASAAVVGVIVAASGVAVMHRGSAAPSPRTLPGGSGTTQPGPAPLSSSGSPSSSGPSSSGPSPSGLSPSADPSDGPSFPPRRDPENVAYPIPGALTFTAADFAGITPVPRSELLVSDHRLVPTLSGQGCDSGDSALVEKRMADPGLWPVAAATQTWLQPNSSAPGAVSIDLTITGWAEGTVERHWTELTADTGPCRLTAGYKPVQASGVKADAAWAATQTTHRGIPVGYAYAAARVGNVIVTVTVSRWRATSAPLDLATGLVSLATDRAVSTGLVATAQGVTGIPATRAPARPTTLG